MIAYELGQRRREIGIRAALGAPRWRVTALMLLDAAKLAAAGVLIGLPAAVLAMQMLREAVYPTSPTDAGVYMIVAITTVLVAILAAYVPAWRAGRVDPIIAMKAS